MKYYLLLIFIFTSGFLIAQQNRAGISFSPDITYRKLDGPAKTYRDDTEMPKTGFTIGLNYGRQLSQRFWVTTGLFYANKGYRTTKTLVVSSNPPAPFYTPGYVSRKYSFYQLGIPIGVSYYLLQKKTRIFANAGININYLTHGKVTLIKENNGAKAKTKTGDNMDFYNRMSAGAEIALGIERDIKGITLRLSPRLRHSFTNNNNPDLNLYKMYLYSFDLSFGVLKAF